MPVAFPSATRLHFPRTILVRRWNGAYVLEDRVAARSFSSPRSARTGGPLLGDTNSELPALVDELDGEVRSGTTPRRCRPAPSVPTPRSPQAYAQRPACGLMRAFPRKLRRRAGRR